MAPGTTATVMVNVSSSTAVGNRISQGSHGMITIHFIHYLELA